MLGDKSVVTDFSRLMKLNPDIFKAYDVRGTYPDEVHEEAARAIGTAFVAYLGAKQIGVGRDMRLSSPALAAAFIDGAIAQGAEVVDYGMIPTDTLYFAVARDGLDGGVEITASHNPKQYNGMKMVRREAFPLSGDAGISDIRDMIAGDRLPPPAPAPGRVRERNVVAPYVEHVLSFIDPAVIRPFNAVLDAGSGMGGLIAPLLFDALPCKTTRLCFEIDGRFPNHEANPLIEENRRDIVERVIAEKADIGIAWDGDADRCFFIDGAGEFVPGDFVTALLAEAFLLKHPGATIIYDLRASHAVKDVVERYGGKALMNRVGHAFFKRRMRETNAIFGGEVTGPLLLPRQLLRGQRLHPGAADAGADVEEGPEPAGTAGAAAPALLHFRGDQYQAEVDGRRAGQAGRDRGASTPTASSTSWTGFRWSTRTGTSTCGRRTPSRCCG